VDKKIAGAESGLSFVMAKKRIAEFLRVPPGELTIRALAGDASLRLFFRVELPLSRKHPRGIVMVYPPGAEEEIDLFRRIGDCLSRAGLSPPEIFRLDPERGYIFLEDCGDDLLQEVVAGSPSARAEDLYREAVDQLLRMQEEITPASAPDCPAWERSFTGEKFKSELDFFLEETISGYYGKRITPADRDSFQRFFLSIAEEAASQPRVFCHRDYHSRNLLVRGEKLRVVDFQDGRGGPYTYDLASLLNDPYVELPAELKPRLRRYYFSRSAAGRDKKLLQFKKDFAIMTVQRLLKAAGTFGYMSVRAGKNDYAVYLPRTLKTVEEVLTEVPELNSLRSLLRKYI